MSFISPEFLLTSLLVVLAPGTGTLYTIATGLAAGRRRSFAAAFGCTLGIIPHLLAAVTGLAALSTALRNSSVRSNISVSPGCCTWHGIRSLNGARSRQRAVTRPIHR
nr:LysE family transporter [Raoultella ornithinolytica]